MQVKLEFSEGALYNKNNRNGSHSSLCSSLILESYEEALYNIIDIQAKLEFSEGALYKMNNSNVSHCVAVLY